MAPTNNEEMSIGKMRRGTVGEARAYSSSKVFRTLMLGTSSKMYDKFSKHNLLNTLLLQ